MSKIYSKEELEAKAKKVFETYPSAKEVYAREDGNIFLEKNYAELNAGDMKIFTISKSGDGEVENDKKTDVGAIDVNAAEPVASADAPLKNKPKLKG